MTTSTILCVAGDAGVLQALKEQLGDAFSSTHRVEAAESAEKALEALDRLTAARSVVALVVADMALPDLRGDELLARILARAPAMRTILLAGPADGGAAPHHRLARPWDRAELASTAAEALRAFGRSAAPPGPPSPSTDDVFDPAVLADLRRLRGRRNMDIFQSLLSAFRGEAPNLLAAMRTAVAEGDAAKLRSAAHALKGAAGSLGARHVADFCATLEKWGRAGVLDGAGPLLAILEPQLERVYQALEAEHQRRP